MANMNDNAVLIPILTDVDISNAAGTTPVVVYGQALPFIYRAEGVEAWLDIFSMSVSGGGTGTVKVFGEYSVDGINWKRFTNDLFSGRGDGPVHGTVNTDNDEYGPFVRFNVSLEQTTANPVSARLTVVVNVRFW